MTAPHANEIHVASPNGPVNVLAAARYLSKAVAEAITPEEEVVLGSPAARKAAVGLATFHLIVQPVTVEFWREQISFDPVSYLPLSREQAGHVLHLGVSLGILQESAGSNRATAQFDLADESLRAPLGQLFIDLCLASPAKER